ncbi:MAG: methyltransferase domain-containing protein [Actinomycetota bacterium]|nr:methyltransferase domain-containing protein [Actinomycetota bacterium]
MTQRDLWNERYRERGAVWGVGPNQFVAERMEGMTPRRVLDLGSGQGRNAIWMAQQGHRVTAVDISDVATGQGQEMAEKAGVGVEFIAADIGEWEPPHAAFDLVLLAYIQLPESSRCALHVKAMRALAPGGSVLVVAHHRDNLENGVGGPPLAEMLFTEDELASDFAGLDIVENSRVLRHVDNGDVVGDAIDIVFIGEKLS